MKTLIVVDMQNDFISGSLGTPEAVAIVPNVLKKLEEYFNNDNQIIYTRDTHYNNYLESLEGQKLPIKHCIHSTHGWEVSDELFEYFDDYHNVYVINKSSFGYNHWDHWDNEIIGDIEIVGLCTDICVVSNALILKAIYPNKEITVDASCCAGTTPENHKAALQVMKCCQINVIGE
jgi:nicotinamidase-related amidase